MKRLAAAAAALAVAGGVALVGGSPAHAAGVPACTNADLKASFRATDAGMSHVFGVMTLTNVSDHRCTTGGYGGLSYVGGGDGTQVGRAASRDPGTKVTTFILAPGRRAVGQVSMTSTGPYDKDVCHPTKIDGFRVYVPNSHASQFVAYKATVCGNKKIKQLSHQAYKLAR